MNRYHRYQNVNSYWYDEVPEHWKKTKNKYVFHQDKKVVGSSWEDYVLLTMGKSGVKPRDMEGGGKFPASFENYQVVTPNQIIFCLFDLDETPRTVGKSSDHGMITSAYDVFSTTPKNYPQFWTYFYQMIDDHKGLRPYYTGLRKVVRSETFMGIEVFSPPIEEQKLISRYLDKKTSQIDSLVDKIQKKIELLKEQRTSLINHYVTKGLDPNVEMKDSGIEWIGEIPKHWGLKKLKYVVQIQKDIVGELGHDVLSVTQGGLKIKDLSKNEGQMSMDYSKYQQVTVDQFVMNHMDLLTGYVDQSKYNGVTSPDYRVFSLVNPLILTDYLLRILQFGYMGKIFYRYGRGVSSMGRWRLPSDEFLDFSIPVPPVKEQENIVQQLGRKISYDYGLIDKELKRVKLLKEYRQSLISSVVTGKVRVTEDMV